MIKKPSDKLRLWDSQQNSCPIFLKNVLRKDGRKKTVLKETKETWQLKKTCTFKLDSGV